MSFTTWCKEFYPVPASDFDGVDKPKEAVKHALNKWRGLLPKNLKKHGIKFYSGIFESDYLCEKRMKKNNY